MAAFWLMVASSAQQNAPGACLSMFGIMREGYSVRGLETSGVTKAVSIPAGAIGLFESLAGAAHHRQLACGDFGRSQRRELRSPKIKARIDGRAVEADGSCKPLRGRRAF